MQQWFGQKYRIKRLLEKLVKMYPSLQVDVSQVKADSRELFPQISPTKINHPLLYKSNYLVKKTTTKTSY